MNIPEQRPGSRESNIPRFLRITPVDVVRNRQYCATFWESIALDNSLLGGI